MSEFVHLHNHTHFSLQDAACTVKGLVRTAKEFNMSAVALTDHGVLYGVPEFYKACKDNGIKPIVGMEAYIVLDGSRFDKGKFDASGRVRKKPYRHLILLAKDLEGYKNLVKLSSIGFLEGFYYRPRIDMEMLQKYSSGLICTSACLGGVVSAFLVEKNYDKARSVAKEFKDVFGDDFYLEIQDHGIEHDAAVLTGMPKLSRELDIKMIATNDCHYLRKEDSIAHNILLLMSDKTGEVDYKKLRYGTDQIYFKSTDEMVKLFKNYKGAIENTLEIADKTNINLDEKQYHFPVFPIPAASNAKDLDGYFDEIARARLPKRYKEVTPEIQERFEYELNTIKSMGFSGYFLVVQDFINAAKDMGIPVGPGRGSAAGSIVAYVLGITNIDPIPFNLLFERFLNPARKSMPDIDVDFADDKRADVIEYVKQKYGAECVAQIATFNRLSSKAVLKDVGRVLKIPIPTIARINKFIPSVYGKVASIQEAIDTVPELKWVKDTKEPELLDLIKYAKVLEGMNRNLGKHAAGVVIAPGEVSKYVPLASTNGQEDVITQYNMKELEDNGLLKMDFLGLRTLTIIRDAVGMIKKNHGIDIDVDTIPTDDEKTYQLFGKGQTTGIFQFESGPMREYLKKLKPVSIADLSAMNALYRPGPMEFIDTFIDCKYGRKQITYLHPTLEPILKETNGVIVYQEQVIQIANRVGGMSLAEADILRRAMGKKDKVAMQKQSEKFVEGAMKNGITQKTALEIFEAIDKFANYGFNKSHSVAYSYVAYQTAYLKAHYTPEFLAANMTNEFTSKEKVAVLLDDCRKLHIEVLPPDINNPSVFFDVQDGKIRFGLSAIRNVGVNAVGEIIRKRQEFGKNFVTIFDLCAKCDSRVINKKVLEGLTLAGAFDGIHKNRRQVFEAVESAIAFGNSVHTANEMSRNSLFGDMQETMQIAEPEFPDVEDWSEQERLSKEREFIGFYITNHPLRKYELEYRSLASIHLGEVDPEAPLPSKVKACGVITDLRTKIDSKGKTMAFFSLDDLSGSCECLMFGTTYEKFGRYIEQEKAVMLTGEIESSGDSIKLQIDEVFPMETVRDRFSKFLKIVIEPIRHTPAQLEQLEAILKKHHGNMPVIVEYYYNGSSDIYILRDLKIKLSTALLSQLAKLYGEDMIWLMPK
ncbi:MAG: DNA polymerase III subunit alpha [Ignavibacteriales bacterium]|nr:DNA polymerase III subunit alpha [Ignavibacteriales bacterium]